MKHFKLLGFLIDGRLRFDEQLCKRINSKTYSIYQNSRFFPLKFKFILFKLFIQPSFDYCSTIYSSAATVSINRLEGCFSRSIKWLLRLAIRKKDLSSQLSEFSRFKLLPLWIRLFQRFFTFVIKVVGYNNFKLLVSRIKEMTFFDLFF